MLLKIAEQLIHIWRPLTFLSIAQFHQKSTHLAAAVLGLRKIFYTYHNDVQVKRHLSLKGPDQHQYFAGITCPRYPVFSSFWCSETHMAARRKRATVVQSMQWELLITERVKLANNNCFYTSTTRQYIAGLPLSSIDLCSLFEIMISLVSMLHNMMSNLIIRLHQQGFEKHRSYW